MKLTVRFGLFKIVSNGVLDQRSRDQGFKIALLFPPSIIIAVYHCYWNRFYSLLGFKVKTKCENHTLPP